MMVAQLDYWHWWILAAVLIIFEVFAPGAFFLWLGIAAAALGGLVYLSPSLALSLIHISEPTRLC